MAWKNFVGPLALTSRQRVIASALMYGLSLTVRLTSPAGEEVENPQAAQSIGPLRSIMIDDGVRDFKDRLSKPAQPVVLHRDWLLVSRGCRAECERPMPPPSMPDCPP